MALVAEAVALILRLVAVLDEGLNLFLECAKLAESAVLLILDRLIQNILGALPSDGSQFVSLAVFPYRGVVAVVVLSAESEGGGQNLCTGENGDARRLSGIVEREPANAAHLIGQPVAQLNHGGIGAPSHSDGATELNGILIQEIVGGLRGAGHPGVGDGAHKSVAHSPAVLVLGGFHVFDVAAHVHTGAFVGAAEEFHHLARIDMLVGMHGEGQLIHVHREPHRGCQSVEDEELALAEVLAIGIFGNEGFPEDELALAVPEFVFLGHFLDIVGGHEIVGVGAVHTTDTRNVGRDADMLVGYALGSPDGADLVLAAAHDLKLPDLVFVGNGYALALVAIAVLLHQVANQADGVAGVVAAFKDDAHKFLDIEHAILVDQAFGTAESSFSDGQLLLIHAGVGSVEVGVGVCHLRDGAHLAQTGGVGAVRGMHRAFVDFLHGLGVVVLSRLHGHPSAVNAVASVRGDDAAVHRGFLANHDAGAVLSVAREVLRLEAKGYKQNRCE